MAEKIPSDRELKNKKIKESIKETKARHASMDISVVELKLDLKCLNKTERSKLCSYFIESKWLRNYLIGLSDGEAEKHESRSREIYSLDKDRNRVPRTLTMPAKLMQDVEKRLKNDKKSLVGKKRKGGKIGKLKFCSQYSSITLNQYGNTHWICYGPEGNEKGKYKNTVHIVGIKRPIRVFGMHQIPEAAELGEAKLVGKPSGIYLMLECFTPRSDKDTAEDTDSDRLLEAVGIDLGIKTTITTSDGKKYDISIRETERLKGLQKKLARQVKHSKGWYDTKKRIQREYERITNRRKDAANKTFSEIQKGKDVIVIQDDSIAGWHKGLFGKDVQNSCLGTLKAKFKADSRTMVIGQFFPSTAVCPICGHKHDGMKLGVERFVCPHCGYCEERDTKAAITTLLAGEIEHSSTHAGHMRTPVELTSDFRSFYEGWKQSVKKPEAITL